MSETLHSNNDNIIIDIKPLFSENSTRVLLVIIALYFFSQSMYLNQKIVVIQHSFRSTGGTIDITVHEVVRGGKLRELTIASGGDWGGTLVD